MIASPQNEKLKLVRKLRERKHREREGLFATEGEDLVEAGLAAGRRAALPAQPPPAPGLGRRGGRAGAARRASPRSARARGRSRSGRCAGAERPRPPCVYLHGVADPGNVGAIVRTADALLDGSVVARPRLRRPLLAEGGAGQHGLDLRPAAGCGPRWGRRRRRGRRWSPTAAPASRRWRARRRSASAPSARGCRTAVLAECEVEVTIPLRAGGAESLNVAAAAAIACAADIVARHAGGPARCLSGSRRSGARPRRRSGPPARAPRWRSCGSATSAAKPS